MSKISNLIGKYMAWIVLVIAALALFLPGTCLWIQTKWINYLLMIVMFGMGLTMKLSDFTVVFKQPRDVITGCVAQFVIMPLLAFGLGKIFGLSDELLVGVVLVGTCPGGTSSNVITYLSGGDTALSVGMTSINVSLAQYGQFVAVTDLLQLLGNAALGVRRSLGVVEDRPSHPDPKRKGQREHLLTDGKTDLNTQVAGLCADCRRVDRDAHRAALGNAGHAVVQQDLVLGDKTRRRGAAVHQHRQIVVAEQQLDESRVFVVDMDGGDQIDGKHTVDVIYKLYRFCLQTYFSFRGGKSPPTIPEKTEKIAYSYTISDKTSHNICFTPPIR